MIARAVVLGMGSNLGGRRSILRAAVAALTQRLGDRALRVSPLWRTAPLGPPQPHYLNGAIALETSLPLDAILGVTQEVEALFERERAAHHGPRTLDIDILWHDGPAHDEAVLTVPHRGLRERSFALAPLLALVPEARDLDGARLDALPAAQVAPGEPIATALDAPFETRVRSHTADEGFVVQALDRADLLAAAAEALGAIIVDPKSVTPSRAELVEVSLDDDDDDDARLVAVLSACLHLFDAGRFAPHRVATLADGPSVRLIALGEALDEERHAIRTAVKAITWHGLEVCVGGSKATASVIVDL